MRLTELTSDLQALRRDLAEELLAINRYEEQLFSLSDEDAKEAVNRIVEDTKGHVAQLLGQIQRLDVKQREKLERS
jgi:rubrerythrin